MKLLRVLVLILVGILGLCTLPVSAQGVPVIQGDFVGTVANIHLKLHIVAGANGALSGTLDSPDQGATGIPCADLKVQGQTLSFAVPAANGSWSGAIQNDGSTLAGTWEQGGGSAPLTFTRDSFVAASKPSPVDGYWLGTLQAGAQSLRIQLSVKSDRNGQEFCAMDSLDQGAFGLPCANVVYSGTDFSFDVPVVKGHWAGKLSSDGQALMGAWSQGVPMALNLARQAAPITPPPPPKVSYSPAMAPADSASMQSLLDRDLEQALKSGALAPQTFSRSGDRGGARRDAPRLCIRYRAAELHFRDRVDHQNVYRPCHGAADSPGADSPR